MFEPKMISPLLDGFVMGQPLSEHDGVVCCPAMRENSDDKYIVKVISVPASQTQLEALLLTGAYRNPADAMDYFKSLADGIVKEAEFLRKVSKLEGFLPYDSWQVVPMEDNQLGYLVYLVSPYKQSLEKYTRRNPVTHLNAVNLGLDLCAAMAICRRAGCMCVDLKPTNIFLSEDKEFRIGDLGFLSLKSLKYATIPSKYISAYTAPELLDPMAALNTTADIYATGMILYQIYNNGVLPFEGHATAETYPSPANADYEIAEIIMKAIAPDPKDRWQDPIAMGQALVAYMQRNGVNDVPIVPPAADLPLPEEAPEADVPADLADPALDETVPGAESEDVQLEEPISDETSTMLAQAEELLAPQEDPDADDTAAEEPEETDEANEADEADIPDVPAEPTGDDAALDALLSDDADPVPEDADSSDIPPETEDEDTDAEEAPAKKKHGWLVALLIVLILALLATGGYGFYKYYYQQTIDSLHVEPFENQVTVQVDTQMDPSLLHVLCTDIYGTTQQQALPANGQAVFTDLQPDTLYTIRLEVDGFHTLVGSTSTSFSTDAVTTIPSFTAATGNEDGSVMLRFTVDGPDCEDWTVTYQTGDEAPQELAFTGHSVTVTGLTVGETYTFSLQPSADLYLVGENSLEFTASAIILASDLTVADFSGGDLTVTWNAPEDAQVEYWTVHCYNDGGYSETLETTDTTATFSLIDSTKAHNIEVTASGMTQSARAIMSANPTNITSVNFDESSTDKLVISWEFEGAAPEGGWLLMYSYDNSDYQSVIRCDDARVEISPRVPGATYHIVLQSASGTSVFRNTHSYTCAQAEKFADYEITLPYCTFNLCVTPSTEGWKGKDVKTSAYTDTFASGESIAMVIKSSRHYIPKDTISILYVIRDAEGNVIHDLVSLETDVSWYDMWQGQYPYTGLEIPKVPTTPGSYTLELYWNFQAVTTIGFTITE